MSEIIRERLKNYKIQTSFDEQNALKEIAQEIILYALSKTSFFDHAYFCGGTALRIIHGLNRFSEDLDFTCLQEDSSLHFNDYLPEVLSLLNDYGLPMEVKKIKSDGVIKSGEIKEGPDHWKLSFPSHQRLRKVVIKLEVDTNPPAGSEVEFSYRDFPILHQVKVGRLETLFAGKVHALLSRPYVKGRDWYDFLWYVKKKASLNWPFLQSAMGQSKLYDPQLHGDFSRDFVVAQLTEKIKSIDWKLAVVDVQRFLRQDELETLKLWTAALFLDRVELI